jgi:hypothetical protein
VFLTTLFACLVLGSAAAPRAVFAQPPGPCCVVPDNGTGTADHVPSCFVGYDGQLQIIDGLPPNTTIEIVANFDNFAGLLQIVGGGLGGNKETWTGTISFAMTGTGALAGFNKNLILPLTTGESHSAPRTLFAPSQSFDTDMYLMFGLHAPETDFDLLRITAGSGFGLPSPGHTTFTQDGSAWAVDSFFDITYRIDFVGAPAGDLGGMSGSTTGSYRFTMCHDRPTPLRRSTWGTVKAFYR